LRAFVYNGLPTRVVFGIGSVRDLPAEVERLGAKRVLVVSTPGRAEMVRAISRSLNVAGVFDKALMHTPVEAANEARALANSVKADCCVVIGGGSTIGFGKAIALTSVRYYIAKDATTLAVITYGVASNQFDPQGADDIASTFQWQ